MNTRFVDTTIVAMATRTAGRFLRDAGGGMTMQAELIFGAAGLAMALIGPPLMESAGTYMAQATPDGIDRTTTGSVSNGTRYTIRKSVLSDTPQIVCGSRVSSACLPEGR